MSESFSNAELKKQCRVITPPGIVSYPKVWEAAQVLGKGEFKFSVSLLVSKQLDAKNKVQWNAALKAIRLAKIVKWGENERAWPKDLLLPITNGDNAVDKNTGGIKEGHAGCWVVRATSKAEFPPKVFRYMGMGAKPRPMTKDEEDKIYPGCMGRIQVYAYGWEYMGKNGISFGFNALEKLKDGEVIGGSSALDEAFGAVAVEVEDDEMPNDGPDEGDGLSIY